MERKRRAVAFIQGTQPMLTPRGPEAMPQERVVVFELETTLEQLFAACKEHSATKVVVVFETADPRPL